MHTRSYKCPYCFTDFKTCEDHNDVEFGCDNCGNDFTLGEARRGKPDPAPSPASIQLARDVSALQARIAQLEDRLANVEAAIRWA